MVPGIGKTTLLRAIAARELQLPSHVTVLHVEQEVVGDETTAVDSVLESDQERTRLLRREKELTGMKEDGLVVWLDERSPHFFLHVDIGDQQKLSLLERF